MAATKDDVMEQLSRILTIIQQQYIEALSTLHKKLDSEKVEWTIGGDLGEELVTVNVEPDCIEILTTKDGAEQITHALEEFKPSQVIYRIQKLSENAIIAGKEYPVYVRSYYSDFSIGTVKVKVHGGLQYRIDNWDWGDKMEFTPEYVYVAGVKTAVVPLQLKYELHKSLGWMDRAEKVNAVIMRGQKRR